MNGANENEPLPDLRQFTHDFFTCFGAQVAKADRRKHGPLRVRLSEELADYFECEELTLAFQHVDLGSGQELVAYGSRIFDRMLGYLDRTSALTVQQLPKRFRPGNELFQAVRPVNAAVAELKTTETVRRLFVFNWHVTYRADDKREELYTVVVDENGDRVPLHNDPRANGAGFDIAKAMAEADQAGAPEQSDASSARQESARSVKLPPMTHLARHAAAARKYAVYHADLRCAIHEAEILPRLHKALSRLTAYYQQQIDEVYNAHDPEFEQRRALEADLERKIAEEVENHRLRVTVTLSSYAVLTVPAAMAELTLQTGAVRSQVVIERNLYSGDLRRPSCHACGRPAEEIAIDRLGHLTCTACRHQCATCQALLCAACGVHECPACRRENCAQCSVYCWACGEHACPEHADRCPICGDTVCHACQQSCAACGVRQCTSHLRRDAVADMDDTAEKSAALICRACAIRCPGCRQFSARTATCTASGQRFCQNCIVACASCAKLVGPGFYASDPVSGAALCRECVLRCPACAAVVAEATVCAACQAPCCAACGNRCIACNELFCAAHTRAGDACDHAVCAAHAAACAVGGEALCPRCAPACPNCGRLHCTEHTAACSLCHLPYCTTCLDERTLCAACRRIDAEGVETDLRSEPFIDDPRVADVAPYYSWRRIDNRRYSIYLGKGLYMSSAIVTVEKTPTGGRVEGVRELELDDLLHMRFWRSD